MYFSWQYPHYFCDAKIQLFFECVNVKRYNYEIETHSMALQNVQSSGLYPKSVIRIYARFGLKKLKSFSN